MDLKLIYALVLTVLPVTELRVGMPLAVSYALETNFPLWLVFSLVVLLNILLILFVFFFLDHLHLRLMKWKFYNKIFSLYFNRFRKKVDKFETRYASLGFLALVIFVAVPLPGTGAWTGCLAAWLLDLDRKKSMIAIALGIIIAGTIIFFASLGVLNSV